MVVERNVIIFGAGEAGRKLLLALSRERIISVIAFIDDDKNLQGATISNLNVFSRKQFSNLFKKDVIDEIFIAIPSVSERQRKDIVRFLKPFSSKLSFLPGFYELLFEGDISRRLTRVGPEDFLGRPKIEIDSKNFNTDYLGKYI